MNTNPTLQDRAVEAAARFLEVRGYETLATGWKSPEARGAIDLVARDPESDDLVFVDVSARPNSGTTSTPSASSRTSGPAWAGPLRTEGAVCRRLAPWRTAIPW